MKRLLLFILTAFFPCAAFAQASQPASAASIEKLLDVMQTRQLHESLTRETTGIFDQTAERMKSRFSPSGQEKFKKLMIQMDATIREEMSWEKMKPQHIKIYVDNYTQQEVDDLIAFYRTPSGQSFVKKQPVVLKQIMALSQEKLNAIMAQLPLMVNQLMTESP